MTDTTPSAHLTPKQLAERLGVSERTIDRFRVNGDGPRFLRVGARRIVYPLAEVQRWEAGRMATSRAEELADRHGEAREQMAARRGARIAAMPSHTP